MGVERPVSVEGRRFESLVGLAQAIVVAGPAILEFLGDWGPDPDFDCEPDADAEPEPEAPGRG